jgi:hypothetical protein
MVTSPVRRVAVCVARKTVQVEMPIWFQNRYKSRRLGLITNLSDEQIRQIEFADRSKVLARYNTSGSDSDRWRRAKFLTQKTFAISLARIGLLKSQISMCMWSPSPQYRAIRLPEVCIGSKVTQLVQPASTTNSASAHPMNKARNRSQLVCISRTHEGDRSSSSADLRKS